MSESRRPIATRNAKWVQNLAAYLAKSDVTPNEISIASVAFAGVGFLCLLAASHSGALTASVLLILAAVAVQLRLLCNLLDGIVAVEGGKGGPTGAFWNEAPDRAADLLFFWGAGFVAGSPALGLGCGALAIGTAYIREMGRAEGFAPDFSGPFAKPQRMAALTLACVAAGLLGAIISAATLMGAALVLILAGTGFTALRRSHRLLGQLKSR